MIRRDYLQEIGLDPVEKTVPWLYALAILVILLAGVEWFAGRETKSHRPPLPQMSQRISFARISFRTARRQPLQWPPPGTHG